MYIFMLKKVRFHFILHFISFHFSFFDDKTDSKLKWVQNLIVYGYVMSDYLVYSVKISICHALLQYNDEPCRLNVSRLTQWIRKIKTFKLLIKTLSSQKTQGSSVECWDHCDRIETVKSIVLSLRYPCFAKIFNFFVKNWNC